MNYLVEETISFPSFSFSLRQDTSVITGTKCSTVHTLVVLPMYYRYYHRTIDTVNLCHFFHVPCPGSSFRLLSLQWNPELITYEV